MQSGAILFFLRAKINLSSTSGSVVNVTDIELANLGNVRD